LSPTKGWVIAEFRMLLHEKKLYGREEREKVSAFSLLFGDNS
jgi:hypothetical protein